jgi:hypothetical protein
VYLCTSVGSAKSQAPHKPLYAKRYGRVSRGYNLIKSHSSLQSSRQFNYSSAKSNRISSLLSAQTKPATCGFPCICIAQTRHLLSRKSLSKHRLSGYRLSWLPLRRLLCPKYPFDDRTSRKFFPRCVFQLGSLAASTSPLPIF